MVETGQSLNNIALTYYFMNELQLALSYSQKSLAIRSELGDKEGLAECYNNLALSYIKQGNWQLALDYMKKSLQFLEEINSHENIPIVLINIGNTLLEKQLYNEARIYFNNAYDLEKQNNRLVANYNYHRNLYKLFNEQSNYPKALNHFKLHIIYKDSIAYNEQQQYISELNIQYNVEKKEQDIKLLQSTQEINDIKLSSQKTWLYILTVGIILTFIFLSIVIVQMLKKNKAYKILAKKSLEITQSNKLLSRVKVNKELSTSKDQNVHIEINPARYVDSQMSEEQKLILLKLILDTMAADKPYLDKSLTLETFSNRLNFNRSYISQVINEELNLNFRNFINEYRVKDALQMLTDPANKMLTIESIGLSVGFGSKSAFYTAFKHYTGITPSFYLKSLGEK